MLSNQRFDWETYYEKKCATKITSTNGLELDKVPKLRWNDEEYDDDDD